jgi:hypothetical protein
MKKSFSLYGSQEVKRERGSSQGLNILLKGIPPMT